MRIIEGQLVKKLGKDWLNKENSKRYAFGIIRMAISQFPCDAFVFVSAGNQFQATQAFRRLGAEQQKAILNSGHDRHHRGVKEGLFTIQDCLQAMAQTTTRGCVYVQYIGDQHNFEGAPEVNFFDQRELQGTMKLWHRGPTMTNEQMIELVLQVERNAGSILVRECVNGEFGNVSLLELPTHLAIQHTCRIIRTALRHDSSSSPKLPS